MKIEKAAMAGTLESNDVLVSVSPNDEDGVSIELNSIVGRLYGDGIVELVKRHLADLGVSRARLVLQDRGALDFAIKARVETAVRRAGKEVASDA